MSAGISFHRSAAPADLCVASGWQLHHACTHGGRVTCPRCSREVGVTPGRSVDGRLRVVVVGEHRERGE